MAIFGSPSGYRPAKRAIDIPGRPWQTGSLRLVPVKGLAHLVIAILCGIAAMVILSRSNDMPLDNWRVKSYAVQPTVILSILATVANASFRCAFREGVRISWWTTARKGTTIDMLHRCWVQSKSVMAIFTSGKQITPTAIASFFVLLILVDGPLLQRASSVSTVKRHLWRDFTIPISPSPLIIGATGIYGPHENSGKPRLYSSVFGSVLQQYNNRARSQYPILAAKERVISKSWHLDGTSTAQAGALLTA
ncbi:hypothetical protein LTR37_011673 [Vermiconidia calcicola]|uniref:Uncharacterized protein n=1 Tax=Vermiconidia calcicola TaxID=1690605 RepID=A0ACC3N386_9PEZI|nr:hypothetical protein LTR37_011673 [Vermiconidia calcicola]